MKREFKVKIFNDQKLSEAIQTKLFELGYRWVGEPLVRTDPVTTGSYGIYANRSGLLSYASVDTGGDFFRQDPKPEITVDELFQMEPEVRETIKIGETTYDKKEFEQATKHLKPVNP